LEDLDYRLSNLPKPQPNRQTPNVIVHSDSLTNSEREEKYRFALVDTTKNPSHQIEGIFWDGYGVDLRKDRFYSEAASLFSQRIPNGTVASYDELHLRSGSVANILAS
jgi:hypothetical protein